MSALSITRRPSFRALLAALAGFALPLQTVWLLRTGTLCASVQCIRWPLGDISVFAGDLVLLAFACVGVRWWWRQRRWRFFIGAFVVALIAGFNVAVSAAGENPLVFSGSAALAAAGWLRIGALALAIVGAASLPKMARPFTSGFVAAIGIHAVLGIVQFVTGEAIVSTLLGIAPHAAAVRGDAVVEAFGGRWLRAYGGFPHPNILGTALLVAMVACVGTGWSRQRRIALLLLFTSALLLTFSRAAWAGYAALLIVWACRRNMRTFAAWGAVALVIGAAVLWPFVAGRVTMTGRLETKARAERFAALDDAQILRAHARPYLLGIGLHRMPPQILQESDSARSPYTAQPVHNVPILALLEVGIVGVVAIILMFAAALVASRALPVPWTWAALLPTLIVDHHLWSLAVGPALLLALFAVTGVPSTAASRTP